MDDNENVLVLNDIRPGPNVSYSDAVLNILFGLSGESSPEFDSMSPQVGSASVSPLSSESPNLPLQTYTNLERLIQQQQEQYRAENVRNVHLHTGRDLLTLMAGVFGNYDNVVPPQNIDANVWNLNRRNVYIISTVPDGYTDNGEQIGIERFHIRGVHAVVMYQEELMVFFSLFDHGGNFNNDDSRYWTWVSLAPDVDGMWDVSNQRLIFDFLNSNNRFTFRER